MGGKKEEIFGLPTNEKEDEVRREEREEGVSWKEKGVFSGGDSFAELAK